MTRSLAFQATTVLAVMLAAVLSFLVVAGASALARTPVEATATLALASGPSGLGA
jgi:hypothetical protein